MNKAHYQEIQNRIDRSAEIFSKAGDSTSDQQAIVRLLHGQFLLQSAISEMMLDQVTVEDD